MPTGTRGFTVIELMIVVAVVAILASLAAPAFDNIIATSRVKTAAADIHLSLVRARSEAIKRNANITVAAPGGWTMGWTVSNGIETHGPLSGTALAISGATTITYTPNGRTTSGPINISLTSGDTNVARCISIGLSGHPSVKQGSCS
jgi:type IV fimbrial biogenesis protein FimT